MRTLEPHPCVGCGANSELKRKERAPDGGQIVTFVCPRCGTSETIRAAADPVISKDEDAFRRP